MKAVASIFLSFSLCFLYTNVVGQIPGDSSLIINDTSLTSGDAGLIYSLESTGDGSDSASFWSRNVFTPMRLTLMHEASYKVESPTRFIKNRTAIRLEYSKFFFKNLLYFQYDSKLLAFWSNDHQAEARDKDIWFRLRTREAFLQASFGRTSIKAGIQLLVLGESDFTAITDVISPWNYSELFFVAPEESRIGQPMVSVDQFSKIGDWTFFFIPIPAYNEYPRAGSAYGIEMLRNIEAPKRRINGNDFEYGMKWKKTIGNSDVSILAAHLMDNDFFVRKQRSKLVGMTLNHAKGAFLFKGEVAWKSPRNFYAVKENAISIEQKDVVDASLALNYSRGSKFNASLEGANSHIVGWNDKLQIFPKNYSTLTLNITMRFLNENLSVNWMTLWLVYYPSFLHMLTTTYQWNDKVNLSLLIGYPDVRDRRNILLMYADQKQVNFRIQYQY